MDRNAYNQQSLHMTVIAMRRQGNSYKDIAEKVGTYQPHVRNIINKYAPELKNAGFNKPLMKLDLPVEDIATLRLQGWGKSQIASLFGCCAETIKNRLHEHSRISGKDYGGYIKPTLHYPMWTIETLAKQGLTAFAVAQSNNCSVLDVVHALIRKENPLTFEQMRSPANSKPRNSKTPVLKDTPAYSTWNESTKQMVRQLRDKEYTIDEIHHFVDTVTLDALGAFLSDFPAKQADRKRDQYGNRKRR